MEMLRDLKAEKSSYPTTLEAVFHFMMASKDRGGIFYSGEKTVCATGSPQALQEYKIPTHLLISSRTLRLERSGCANVFRFGSILSCAPPVFAFLCGPGGLLLNSDIKESNDFERETHA